MKHFIKKILSASLSFGFISWFGLFSVFSAPFAFAAPACNDFSSSSYVITNGGPDFLVGDTIKTKISLKAKSTVAGDADYVDVYLVIDTSNSMKGNAKMQAAKDALTSVVNSIQTADGGKLKSKVGLISFTGTVYLKKTLTTDYNSVKTAISGLTSGPAGTGTNINGGLYLAGKKFASYSLPSNTQRFIVLASDGEDTSSPPPTKSQAIGAVPSDVTVHTVGISDKKQSWEDFLKKIASSSGSKNGTYRSGYISDLVEKFQEIITGILGGNSLKNVSLLFSRNDTVVTTLVSTSPWYTSYVIPDVSWANLGIISGGGQKNIYINYTGTAVGTNVPLNLPSITVGYDSVAGTCTGIPLPLPIRRVNIGAVASCVSDPASWSPDPSEFCSTGTFTQTDNCGETRSAAGTLTCTQCNDGIDNDVDGLIDYGGDLGCSSFLDNTEKNFSLRFITF